MMKSETIKKIINDLGGIDSDRQVRLVSVLSAAIARGENELIEQVMSSLKKRELENGLVYETVLQSYLFLGFLRMIEAALVYNKVFGDIGNGGEVEKISEIEAEKWHRDGINLCGVVYGKNYERLKEKFMSVSPEVFRWMVLEGYGKVLSRPGMTQIERELAEVAALIVDKRRRQLVSHIMGSLNVGAPISLIKQVNRDIVRIAGEEACLMADDVIGEIELKYETEI